MRFSQRLRWLFEHDTIIPVCGISVIVVSMVVLIAAVIYDVTSSHRGDVITPNAVYLDCEVRIGKGRMVLTTSDGQCITIQGNATVRWH